MKRIYLLPNFISMANFLSGLYAIVFAIQGRPMVAAYLILLAMIFDFMDGTVARLTRTESQFGLQLDSLCDIVSFGIAPMVMIYALFVTTTENYGWFSGILFAACGALRLARYNSMGKADGKTHFDGLPIPAAAGLMATYVLWSLSVKFAFLIHLTPIVMISAAMLMVSNIKYPSFRKVDFKRRRSLESMIFIVLLAIIASRNVHLFLIGCFVAYVLYGLIMEAHARIMLAKQKAAEVPAKDKI